MTAGSRPAPIAAASMVAHADSSSGPGRRCGNQPSASRPIRSKAAVELPPIQIGIGRWIGSGLMPAAVMRWKRSSWVTLGSVQRRRRSPTCSVIRRPRVSNRCPRASNSTAFQPTPTPRRSRPPLRRSTSTACFATSAVSRWGSTSTLVTSSRVGERSEVAERDERLVERRRHVVGPAPAGVGGGIGAEHVVVEREVLEARAPRRPARTCGVRRDQRRARSGGRRHRSARLHLARRTALRHGAGPQPAASPRRSDAAGVVPAMLHSSSTVRGIGRRSAKPACRSSHPRRSLASTGR